MKNSNSAAVEAVGGLSKTGKMPCHSYNLPACSCRAGSKLNKIKGTICHSCYARKSWYCSSNVKAAMARRLNAINNPNWAADMAAAIAGTGESWFRWHDSGDLQSEAHLGKIFEVCRLTPAVRHWLPTVEGPTVLAVLARQSKPSNLTIRLSSAKIDHVPATERLPRSMVYTKAPPGVHECVAVLNHSSCGECRACWNENIRLIGYKKH